MNPWVSKISPWTAQPLTEASRDAKLRAVLSVAAERVIYGRQMIIVCWTVFGCGITLICVSIFGWVMLFPLKTIQNNMWIADQSTGIISKPLSLEDAPTHFGPAMEEHALHQYLLARERWIPETDREDDHQAKIMSSPEEQARINASRAKPDSNAVAIGSAGHIEIDNDHYFPQFMDKDSETRRYLVRFRRVVWRGSNQEPSEPWSATVDFAWHPERAMNPADRRDNPGGLVVVAYTAKSDIPDQRRQ